MKISNFILFVFISPLIFTVMDVNATTRMALVFGNASYQSAPLKNPVNDANDMTNTLRDLDFEVIKRIDANKTEMLNALEIFYSKLEKSDVGLFYFAGHGIQINDQNQLIPIRIKYSSQDELLKQTVEVASIIQRMKKSNTKTNIIILDACRNNPYVDLNNLSSNGNKNRGVDNEGQIVLSPTKGLAKMSAPVGTFIAFATSPGSVAIDGSGNNGVYTKHLKTQLKKSNWSIEKIFKETRRSVVDETNGEQLPWDRSSLMDDFYFVQPKKIGNVVRVNEKWSFIEVSPKPGYRFNLGDVVFIKLNNGKSIETKIAKVIENRASIFISNEIENIKRNNTVYDLSPDLLE